MVQLLEDNLTLHQPVLVHWSLKIHTWKGNLGSKKGGEIMVQPKKLPLKNDSENPSNTKWVPWAIKNYLLLEFYSG